MLICVYPCFAIPIAIFLINVNSACAEPPFAIIRAYHQVQLLRYLDMADYAKKSFGMFGGTYPRNRQAF